MPMPMPCRTLLALVLWLAVASGAWSAPIDQCVQLSVTTQISPPQIDLHWPGATASGYDIYRRTPGTTSWGSAIASLAGSATGYTDGAVTVGTAYEYQVLRSGGSAWGFVLAGIDALTQPDSRGKLVLLVDTPTIASIATGLVQLEQDLVAEGWTVLRHDVATGTAAPAVRALIQADFNADPTRVKLVYILGHIAVPYAGDTAFDGHYPQHAGAWPSDAFYADMNGAYSDSTVNDSVSGDARLINTPGDGKFDQSYVTGSAFLGVGRVDFQGQWQYMDEMAAMRTYLQRAHDFRTRVWTAQQKAVAIDGFGDYAPAVAMALRGFAPLVGTANLTSGGDAIGVAPFDWWPTMSDASLSGNPYIWAYQSGPGYQQGIINNSHVSSWDFLDGTAHPSHAVFTAFFGSYFGDWGFTPSLLMAPLWNQGGEGLASFWGGWPGWPVHLMGLGQSLGDVARATVGHSGDYREGAPAPMHVALMGDPSLRLHPLRPPGGVSGSVTTGSATISWLASVDAGLGYQVYRAATAAGPFTRLTASPISAASYVDAVAGGGTFIYLVKSVRRETSPSGCYLNASIGAYSPAVTIPGGGTTSGTSGTTSGTSATTSGTSGTTSGTSGTASTTSTSGTTGGTSGTSSTSGSSTSGSTATTGTTTGSSSVNPNGGGSQTQCGVGSGGLGLLALALVLRGGRRRRR